MELLSGNEAIAQGAWEAGARVGCAYPGTPSTETMENFAKKDGVYAEWCPNEKVAVETAVGACAAGARALATMKHVGVNVAADPLFTAAYTGVNAGLVVLAADDPGMHSSQNEQDSRFYAQAAHIPMLEPADSQEAHDFARAAYEISEEFDLPVFLRTTVRTSHAKSPVAVGERITPPERPYKTNPAKWVMMPAFAKPRRRDLDARMERLRAWVEETELNVQVDGGPMGVVCTGAVYQYVRDALPEASVLKLGVAWPVPAGRIRAFAERCDSLYVIEEASDYLSQQVRACGVSVAQPPRPLPLHGELTPGRIAQSFGEPELGHAPVQEDLPGRPPAFCAGCPHRLVFKELSRAKCIVTGDIGCYTLGALPPLSGMDTTVCMGASVSMSHGFELALANTGHRPVVGVIGDSTFGHSGLSSLLGTVYNKGCGTICILDNRTTAMTGHQGNMFNGITLQHRPTREMDLEGILSALGIEDVQVVNPNDMQATRAAIQGAIGRADALSVIIFRSPCAMLRDSFVRKPAYAVSGACRACGMCTTLGCPALSRDAATGVAAIDAEACVGCGQCAQYCNFGAIAQPVGDDGEGR